MISYKDALEIVLGAVPESVRTRLPLREIQGYVLAEDISSAIDVSSFRSSSMDGFAVCSSRLAKCSAEHPVKLPIGATVFAGEMSHGNSETDHVIKVMTGAPVPDGFDAVVKFEDTRFDSSEVVFTKPVAVGENIRQPGEDIKRGRQLFAAGHVFGVFDTGVLASIGLKEIPVFEKPTALVVSTGGELVEPGTELTDGQIYDSNRFTIVSMIKRYTRSVETLSAVDDSRDKIESVLQSKQDIIITTGGVSAGERDYLAAAAEKTAWKTLFHRVAVKPGKPIYFAKRDKQLLFGLPGNPLSAAVTCAVFALPALKKLIGYKDSRLNLREARLVSTSRRRSNRTIIWPGKIRKEGDEILAEFSKKESSAALSALLGSDGLILQESRDKSGSGTDLVEVVTWQQVFD